ncbi:putative anti-sigma B factor [Ruegeria lacuscaerulensis ITI-1157]|nr:putative anti-sigma B factor [Ruegeria lacuscaerulensis ITI-1157]SHJ55469.1 serine/threonine-protein kinase RsbW [Ruegeria lacuscaerulensis ITI-1157]
MTTNFQNCRLDLSFEASESEASRAIAAVHHSLMKLGLPADRHGDAKIAIAEAVNNVVEHAYAGLPPGQVQLQGFADIRGLEIRILDSGKPLPGLRVPDGIPASVDTSIGNLPEGGFGWFMIRKLSDDIQYERRSGQNRLSLWFYFPAPEEVP